MVSDYGFRRDSYKYNENYTAVGESVWLSNFFKAIHQYKYQRCDFADNPLWYI